MHQWFYKKCSLLILVDSLNEIFKNRGGSFTDFYVDVCAYIFECDWVKCTSDTNKHNIQNALSSECAYEEVARLLTIGEFSYDRLENDFISIIGDLETSKHLIDTLMNSVANQVFERNF